MSGELASERWSPAQRVETVLLSIISLLDDAEINSPANVDAAVMLRDNLQQYRKRVAEDVEASKADVPADFVIPSGEITATKAQPVKDDDGDFWVDSDAELDFGGSDTDEEDIEEDAEMEEDEDEDDEMDSDKE